LSARWQRVAVQQAAGIAQSWRTNRQKAIAAYQSRLAWYNSLSATQQAKKHKPTWKEWSIPTLQGVCIQANVNVVQLQDTRPSKAVNLTEVQETPFDYWLQVATLSKRQPVYLPVQLAAYHRQKLAGHTPNRSVTLNRRKGAWWLTLTVDLPEPEPVTNTLVKSVDVGIRNFLTDEQGRHYASFAGNLATRHQADRAKRQRKAKLRACLEKKGVDKLPSTSSASGQRLARCVRQSINQAVNQFLSEAGPCRLVIEDLAVSDMRFKAKRMNAYLYASNLAHIPKQLAWAAAKRAICVVKVNSAYTSQECPRCHYTDRANRPNQQTFCCGVCGYAGQADTVGAINIASRVDDTPLAQCLSLDQVKAVLLDRHLSWKIQHGYP
jgi:IS605 OrfB family transposase